MLLCYVIDSGLSTSLLLLATLIIMFYIYITLHGNAVVSARSVQLVVNGNVSVLEAVTGDPRRRVQSDCQAAPPHDVLWRRLDLLGTPGSSKRTALDGDDEVDGDESRPVVARRIM